LFAALTDGYTDLELNLQVRDCYQQTCVLVEEFTKGCKRGTPSQDVIDHCTYRADAHSDTKSLCKFWNNILTDLLSINVESLFSKTCLYEKAMSDEWNARSFYLVYLHSMLLELNTETEHCEVVIISRARYN
jgi:hypothetical protein